jgi:hypothetical protein
MLLVKNIVFNKINKKSIRIMNLFFQNNCFFSSLMIMQIKNSLISIIFFILKKIVSTTTSQHTSKYQNMGHQNMH